MPFHVIVTKRAGDGNPEVRVGLSGLEVCERIVAPYLAGQSILIGGSSLRPDEIARVRVTYTDESPDQSLRMVRLEQDARRGVRAGAGETLLVAERGRDVTDEFLTRAPSGLATSAPVDPHRVFVVHGRNQPVRDSLFSLLRALGLQPIEWSEAIASTGKAAPYVSEVLDSAFACAQAIVVLMTPDDEGCLRSEFRDSHDPPSETKVSGQARLNVIFEAGMALSRFPTRTIIVEVGMLRPFSDTQGRHVVRLSNASERRQDLAMRLRTAGCLVNLDGVDWHSVGDFNLPSGS